MANLESASSDFLQMDDEIAKDLLNFTIVGKKMEIKKKSRKVKKLSLTASKKPGNIESKILCPPLSPSNPERELTAIEIWKRNSTKFGSSITRMKTRKQKDLNNVPFQFFEEMTVGAEPIPYKVLKVSRSAKVKTEKKKKVSKNDLLKLKKKKSEDKLCSSGELLSKPAEESLFKGKRPKCAKKLSDTETFVIQHGGDSTKNPQSPQFKKIKQKSPTKEAQPRPTISAKKTNSETNRKTASDSGSQLMNGDGPPNPSIKEETNNSDANTNLKTPNQEEKSHEGPSNDKSPVVNEKESNNESKFSQKIIPPALRSANIMDMSQYLTRVQAYFDQLGYHREGEPETKVETRLSIKHLMTTSKNLIKIGAPIKCLHALVLGVYFTNHTTLVERFPIHFKSVFAGTEYKHVVLGLYVQGNFGALGISRDTGLQDKAAAYSRLSELINTYYHAYNQSGHALKELKIGAIITHDPHSMEHITWKLGKVNFDASPHEIETEIEKISRKLRAQMGSACLRGVKLDQYNNGFPLQQRASLIQQDSLPKLIRPTKSKVISADPQQLLQLHIQSMRSTRSFPIQLNANVPNKKMVWDENLSQTRSLKRK